MTEKHSQKIRYHWLLWWRIEPDELQRQVREYDSLGMIKSARGLSAVLLALSAIVTIIFVCVGWIDAWSLSDAVLFVGLGVFVYRGHRWAMVCVMVFWTLEKAYGFYAKPEYAVMSVIWWTVYMQAFYMAYRVENAKRAAPKSLTERSA
ncbi:MAG: hypothetical protein WA555_15965 [Candidatus Sulfotelmatobacter sp.]